MLLTEHYNKYFTEEFKRVNAILPLAYSDRDDGDTVFYFKDVDYCKSDGKLYINTEVSCNTKKRPPNAINSMNTFS